MSEELEGLNLVELYEALAPVEAPDPIAMVPQTAGWAWLAAALLVLTIYGVWRWRSWYRANAYRRAALVELNGAGGDAVAIAKVLRRTALAAFPREKVASLYGDGWLAFLDSTARKPIFVGSRTGQILITAPYRAAESSPELPDMAKDWIKHHKREKGSG